nr:hypothetical protein [Tanacetum cinerariifolium]
MVVMVASVVLWHEGSGCEGDVDGGSRGVVVAVWRWRRWGNGGDAGVWLDPTGWRRKIMERE